MIPFVNFFYRLKGEFNMDDLEIIWIVQVFIFYIWFNKTSYKNKIISLVIILLIPSLRGPFICVSLLLLNIFTMGLINFSKFAINYLFETCLKPIFIGYKLPIHPTIIMANYPTNYIEYMANFLFQDMKICFVVLNTQTNLQSKIVKLFYKKENILFVDSKGSFEKTQNSIHKKIQQGYSIFTYIDKKYFKRPTKYDILEIRKGMFNISQNLNIPITPIVFDHIDHTIGLVEHTKYKIFVDKTRVVKDVDSEVETVQKLFKNKLRSFKIK